MHGPGMEEDDFIWGGTEEIVDRPRGCKATCSEGESAGGGCAPSCVKPGSKKNKIVPNTQ